MDARIASYLDERFREMDAQLADALGDAYLALDEGRRAALRGVVSSVVGDAIGLVRKGKDIHERVVQQIVLSAMDAIVGVDTTDRIFFWNRGAELLFGWDRAEVLGRPFGFLGPESPEYLEEVAMLRRRTVAEGVVRNHVGKRLSKDGRVLTVNLSRTLIRDDEGKALGTIIIYHDMTEVKLLERQVLQSEKLALLGQIAAGIAHEIGTPLNIISGIAEVLLLDRDAAHPEREDLESVIGQTDRIAKLIRELLAFARPQPLRKDAVSLAVEIRRAVSLLRGRFEKQGIAVEVDVPADLPALSADANQLQQVLLNLLVNACDALSSDARETPPSIAIRAELTAPEGEPRAVVLRVSDNGPGVAGDVAARVFEPFVTTKDIGEGTGLGLAVCKRIVEEHGGAIALEAGAQGAAFVLRFPVATAG